MKKRIISVILAALILLSCSPLAFAYDRDEFERLVVEAWSNGAESIDVSDMGLYTTEHPYAPTETRPVVLSEFLKIWSENPQFADVYSGINVAAYGDGSVDSINFIYFGYTNEELQNFDNAVNEIAESLKGRSDIDKIIGIYEYLIENAKYDYSIDDADKRKYSSYEAVLGEKTVCQGYSRAFCAIANKMGIKSSYISSKSMRHAWNLVELNGKSYYIDVTWDSFNHDNLLIGEDKLIENNHLIDSPWLLNYDINSIGLYNNKEFENAFWLDAINRMSYVDGYWYYTDGLDIYKATTEDITLSQKLTSHDALDYLWFTSYGATTAYENFSDVEYCDGKLYFSTPYEIRSIDLNGDNEAVVYTLSANEMKKGCIYDLEENNGIITYSLSYDVGCVSDVDKMTYTGDFVVNCHNHNFGAWTVIEPSTCVKLGKESRQCKKCLYNETRALSSYSKHIYGAWEIVTPTSCVAPGERKRVCTVNGCNEVQTESIKKLAHTYGQWETVTEPTCSQEGVQKRVCTNPQCLNVQTDSIPCIPHSFGEWEIITEPTCTDKGESERACSVCGFTERTDTDTAAHNTGADGKCTACGKVTCSCGCHKTGIAAFFWKIVRFFWKVFANAEHKYCECGAVHY